MLGKQGKHFKGQQNLCIETFKICKNMWEIVWQEM